MDTAVRAMACRGLSLVEVAISIAVAGLALMAVVGLVPSLMNRDVDNGINTVLPSLTSQAVEVLRVRVAAAPTEVHRLFFSENGALLADAESSRALYRCRATPLPVPVAPDAEGGAGASRAPDPGPFCRLMILEFTWPSPSSGLLNRRVVHASLPLP